MSTTVSAQLGGDYEDLRVVDCDLHVYPPEEDVLEAFLPERFRGKGVSYPDGNWASPVGPFREDAAVGDLSAAVTDHLDPLGIDRAVVTGSMPVLRAGVAPDRRYATALTSAYNDWLPAERLPADDRLRGSVVVAPVEPAAAAEVRRLGDYPDVVQVVMGGATQVALGEERYRPVYEAAVEHDLPVVVHAGAEVRSRPRQHGRGLSQHVPRGALGHAGELRGTTARSRPGGGLRGVSRP